MPIWLKGSGREPRPGKFYQSTEILRDSQQPKQNSVAQGRPGSRKVLNPSWSTQTRTAIWVQKNVNDELTNDELIPDSGTGSCASVCFLVGAAATLDPSTLLRLQEAARDAATLDSKASESRATTPVATTPAAPSRQNRRSALRLCAHMVCKCIHLCISYS